MNSLMKIATCIAQSESIEINTSARRRKRELLDYDELTISEDVFREMVINHYGDDYVPEIMIDVQNYPSEGLKVTLDGR